MKYKSRLNVGEKASKGAGIGAVVGGLGATAVTILGGYEIGSAVNDYLELTNTVVRGVLDLFIMSIIAGPAYTVGIAGGTATGGAIGAIAHPVIKGTKNLGELVSKGYKKITEKKND